MSIWVEVSDERTRAHAKHGDKSMEAANWDDMKCLRILVEEVGEVARGFNDWDLGQLTTAETMANIRGELIQVAAMAGAWADKIPPPHLAPGRDL